MAKYNITNASQLIDISTINSGCAKIETAADLFEQSAAKMRNASDICNAEALSVDKTTMQSRLDADADYVASIKTAIMNFTLQIKNVALQVYSEQYQELQEYLAEQAAQAAAQQNNSN